MNKIKELRKKTKMTQQEFADYLHIPVHDIRNWEQEFRMPPTYVPDMIERIMINENHFATIQELQSSKQAYIIIKSNEEFYLKSDLTQNLIYLCKVNELNSQFVEEQAMWTYNRIKRQRSFEEWENTVII